MTAVYEARPVKRRRSTRAELAQLDGAIIAAAELENPITLRGVFYRVVSAGAVEKTEHGYDRIQRQLLKLRRDGAVPYHWIIDGNRWITKPPSYAGIGQVLEDAAASYRRDLWHSTPVGVQVYSEKDAISSVVLPVTERWDVPLGIARGYASETFAWSVAQSILRSAKRTCYVYQLGDHDPSGVDAWRAFRERVASFLGKTVTQDMIDRAREHGIGGYLEHRLGQPLGVEEAEPDEDYCQHEDYCRCWDQQDSYSYVDDETRAVRKVTFARLAVTPDQIESLSLPTRPTKQTDSRASGFDGGSVEVDAIPPTVLRQIVSDAITRHIDREALKLEELAEQSEREILRRMAGEWAS